MTIAEIFDDCSWHYSFDDDTAYFYADSDKKHDNVFIYSNFWAMRDINHIVFQLDNILMYSDKLMKTEPVEIVKYFFSQISGEQLDIHKHKIESIGRWITKIT